MKNFIGKTIDNSFLNASKLDNENFSLFSIFLNRPLNSIFFEKIAQLSSHIYAADGGANQIYNAIDQKERKNLKPDYIIGDLDSINQNVKEYYESLGSVVIKVNNQDNTDLEKCFDHIISQYKSGVYTKPNAAFLIIGGFGGRLDHTLSNLSNLQKITTDIEQSNFLKHFQIQMLDEYSIATCILPGVTQYIRSELMESRKSVGLFSLTNQCQYLRTKGLKWDITDALPKLQFGTFVSSSNEFDQNFITIENSDPIILTTTLNQVNEQ